MQNPYEDFCFHTAYFIPQSTRDYFYIKFPVSRSVKLAKVNSLPSAEHQLPAADYHGTGRAHQGSLYMGMGIAFKVQAFPVRGTGFIKRRNHVPHHIRVGVLFIVTPAVVCGTNITAMPSRTLLFLTSSATLAVMSINCCGFVV
jgi:hypothetical protein